ncbi:hypothetical protein NW759_015167 [Fusarium solani]|nr:hypothetical protein NW759_015167 [Fusarium solani]
MEPNAHTSQHDDNGESSSLPPRDAQGNVLKGRARIYAEVQRNQERRREQMTPEERAAEAADIENKARRRHKRKRKAANKAGLAEIALTGYLTEDQCQALLRQPFPPDATAFLRSLDGYLDNIGDIMAFRLPLSYSTQYARPFLLQSAELCKFALVDWRAPHPESVQQRGRSLALDRLYKIYLLEHRRNDRLEQARVVARGDPMQYHLKFI